MKKFIRPGYLDKQLRAPASKSYMQRAIVLAGLSEGKTIIRNLAPSEDCDAAMRAVELLGAKVEVFSNEIHIDGALTFNCEKLNVGESGLGMRMFGAILGLNPKAVLLSGMGSLLDRTMEPLVASLRALGVKVETKDNHAPLLIQGPYREHDVEIDGSISSQVLTGLLMALPAQEKDVRIRVKNLKSKPYIAMTISLMKAFGLEVENRDYKEFYIKGGQKYVSNTITVEGDWSSAAFLAVAGAINGNVRISALNFDSEQADVAIVKVLEQAAVDYHQEGDVLRVKKSKIKAFDFDASDCPDLFPPLVCLAANADKPSTIFGVSRLRHKESNRGEVLQKEFGKLGVRIDLVDDAMIVYPGKIKGAVLYAHNDHRVAMALALAGLVSDEGVWIEGAECVAKSYKHFFDDIEVVSD